MSGKLAEAARYAVLRRLAPAIRHNMMGDLHPIGLIAEVTDRRMREAAPDLASLRENVAKIKTLSRSAMLACTNLMAWLAPEEGTVTALGEGIDECLELLRTEFGLRGFAVQNDAREIGAGVSSGALRPVLSAALLAATDASTAPADLVLAAEVSQGHAVLSIRLRPADRAPGVVDAGAYRALDWSDVDALALAESVELSRQGNDVTMRYLIASEPSDSPAR